MKWLCCLFVFVLSICAAADDRVCQIVEDTLRLYEVPGASVGVIYKGKVIAFQGFGKRNLSGAKVTTKTQFPIGSLTKGFTALVVGQLVEERVVDWDDSVIKVLPEFALWNQKVTEQVTLRDLLAHRVGLPYHDALWFNSKPGWGSSEFYAAGFIQRLRYLEPIAELRERFLYNNLMYAVAGAVVEKVAKKSWEEMVRSRVFEPLGMSQSNFSIAKAKLSGDFAVPYVIREGKPFELPLIDISVCGAAGAINSNLEDMMVWLRFLMQKGGSFVSNATMKELHSIQIEHHSKERGYEDFGYGLGWYIGQCGKDRMIHHEGHLEGFRSMISLFPERELGIVVLSNSSEPDSDFVTDLTVALYKKLVLDQDFIIERRRREEVDKEGHFPHFDCSIDPYVGVYEHPGYGKIRLVKYGKGLVARYYRVATLLKPTQADRFVAASPEIGFIYRCPFEFVRNELGEVIEMMVPLEPKVAPLVFKRVGK